MKLGSLAVELCCLNHFTTTLPFTGDTDNIGNGYY